MVIDKAGFLLMAGTLAAGGAGGWLMRDSKAHRTRTEEVPVAKTVVSAAPAPVVAPPVPVVQAPVCDDGVGTPADCPAVGPADEGVCTNLAARRCADFKSSFKPKVAEAAVSCIRQLKGSEGCDPARVTLCGHEALMAACPDTPPVRVPTAAVGGVTNANGVVQPDAVPAPVSAVEQACNTILKSCTGASIAPTMADCRQTLSGMSEFGRANLIQCMATHCGDKGLLGCEAVKIPAAQ